MDTYTSYTGTEDPNGGDIIWKQSYSTNMPKIGDSYNIGLATSSNNWREQETIYKNYEVDQYFFPSAAPTTSSPPTIDAPPSSDIGNPLNKGSALKLGPGHMIVKGSGRDIWGPSDQFHFLHIKMTGDVTVEMKVLGFDYTVHDWQKGGIMIRDRLTAGSKHFSLFYTGSNGSANQWRTKAWQNSGHNSPNPKSKDLPVWFQVKKVGNEYTASRKFSESGDWMSTEPRKIDFDDEPFYVGIAVTSHVTAKIAFEVEDFTINGKLG